MSYSSTASELDRYKFPPDPAAVLEALGFQKVKQYRSGKINACCLLHGGDNPEGFVVWPEKGTYACGTAACWKGDLIGLVEQVLHVDFKGAIDWLGALLGISGEEWKPVARRPVIHRVERKIAQPTHRFTPEALERSKEAYWAHGGYWQTRRRPFADKTLRIYEAGLVRRREGSQAVGFADVTRAIFPVYSVEEVLVGWTGRATDDSLINDKDRSRPLVPKWRHFPGPQYDEAGQPIPGTAFESRDHFFGWLQASWTLEVQPVAILTESPGNAISGAELAMALEEPWMPLGLFGTALKDVQAQILRGQGVAELWLVLDADAAGEKMIDSVKRLMPRTEIWVIRLPEGIADLGELADPAVYRMIVEARQRVA